ncbi:MAG: winged helix-turn-helix domain-containing protein [Pyrinomonadaceae bacterium]
MGKSSNNKIYEFEEFRLDAAHLMLSRNYEEIPLAPKAVETLLVLVEHRGKILSKDELMDAIWADSIVEESNLAQYLHILRKTLGKLQNGHPYIETLRRRGYRFNGEVTVSESSNGLPPESSVPDLTNVQSAQTETPFVSTNLRPLRVERHGNVIAVADWQEAEPEPVIRAASEPPAPLIGADLPKRRIYAAAIVFSLLLTGAFGFFLFRSQSNSAQATAKSDIVFMNLTDGEDVNNATISPDGNFFAYTSRDGDKSRLFVQQTGQAGRHQIIAPVSDKFGGMSFTPDSQFIYFVADDNGHLPNSLYRVPVFGGVQTKILSKIATMPSFSPDGSEMVFTRGDSDGSRIIIASSDGARERTLAAFTKNDRKALYGGGAWSPDGKTIAYGVVDLDNPHEGNGLIVGTDTISGETRLFSNEKWDNFFRMAWTRDSQGLVFIGTKASEAYSTRRDQVYYLSIPDGTTRRLTNDGNRYDYNSLGVTDKDEVLAVPFNRLSQIWSMETGASGRDVVQITNGFADGRGGISPLNDGRVAYLTRNGDGFSIWTINSDGSSRKQLTTDPPAIEELRSPPDGSFFVFSAKRDGWSHLYRVKADGSGLQQLTFGESWEIDSTISPDGKWIVYDSRAHIAGIERSSLWKISSDGSDPVKLTDEQCVTPHISPDGASVSCVSNYWKTILVISVETGKTTAAFQTQDNPILNIGARWTPDGKSLAYIVSSNLVGNILTQPINGEAPRPLTDFQSGDIYNFAFSTDGQRLYLARGYQTKKAVLIKNFR